MADRIVITNEGQVEQIGTPTEIYEEPATEFVADFIGDTNFLEGDLDVADDRPVLRQNGNVFEVAEDHLPDGEASVFVRPEKIQVFEAGSAHGDANTARGTIDRRIFVGSNTRYHVSVDDHELVVEAQNLEGREQLFERGEAVDLVWDPSDTHVVERIRHS